MPLLCFLEYHGCQICEKECTNCRESQPDNLHLLANVCCYRFSERGRLYAKKEVASIELGPGGLFFTGDRTGMLSMWKWLEEPKVASS